MNAAIALALAGALAVFPSAALAQGGTAYRARLSPVPIEAASVPNITGTGSVDAVLVGTTLTVTGTFEKLQTPATLASLHRAPKGIRGPAVFDLTVSKSTSGSLSATLELTQAQADDLARERFYVQLHSVNAPEGNLWGWLLRREDGR